MDEDRDDLEADEPAANDNAIAVIGMACRFPGAESPDAFWQNLKNGVEGVRTFSDAELAASGIGREVRRRPNYIPARAVLDNVDRFDAAFFGISPIEASIMDPQQRLMMECAWHALEDAGYAGRHQDASIGVFLGAGPNKYRKANLDSNPHLQQTMGYFPLWFGNDREFLPTRISFKLNLQGPSYNVQTACSTSLTAVHVACQNLLSGECDMALAGGVHVTVPVKAGYHYREGSIYAPDGHCRPFDAKAGGTVPGQGLGVVMLKRLEEALEDCDRIHAVIPGSAVNNDGARKLTYTAPSVDGQAEVITEALTVAEVGADEIDYVETHGTATPMGDPIEIAALTRAYREFTDRNGYCALGSLKSNLGHMEAAAGIGGLIKTILSLENRQMPPSLHFHSPNPEIRFDETPFRVNAELADWPATPGRPRRAGVSSFGIGGTNVHMIVEEAPEQPGGAWEERTRVFPLSARTPTALNRSAENLADFLEARPELNPVDAAHTLITGRAQFTHRRFALGRTLSEAATYLRQTDNSHALAAGVEEPPVAFLFSGQGAQFPGMGRDLYECEADFRELVDRCAALLEPRLDLDIRNVLFSIDDAPDIHQTALAQPALLVIEYALATWLMNRGIQPRALIGHSIGEYTAALLAGVFSLEDALTLVCERGRLMQQMPPGKMLAVFLSEEAVKPYLSPRVELAVVNGPELCVLAGDPDAIDALAEELSVGGVATSLLTTSHAFHCYLTEEALEPFRRAFQNIELHPPKLPFLSNVSGDWITDEQAVDPDYWVRHLRGTVRFHQGVTRLCAELEPVLLEVGPAGALTKNIRHDKNLIHRGAVAAMRHPKRKAADDVVLMEAVGALWQRGVSINWTAIQGTGRITTLPGYAFDDERHWVEPKGLNEKPRTETDRKPCEPKDWFHQPAWRELEETRPKSLEKHWLIFADDSGTALQFATEARRENQTVLTVRRGPAFKDCGNGCFEVNPARPQDFHGLVQNLGSDMPRRLVHAWSLDVTDPDTARDLCFYSIAYLARALSRQSGEDRRLDILTRNLHKVAESDPVKPLQALIMGPLHAVKRELPALTCYNLDLDEAASRSPLPWLQTETEGPVTAVRNGKRFLQTYERVEADQLKGKPLNDGQTWLITGGLGAVGMELARHLAETGPVNLALTTRADFPKREDWPQILAGTKPIAAPQIKPIPALPELDDLLRESQERYRTELDVKGAHAYPGLEASLWSLAGCMVFDLLQRAAPGFQPGARFQRQQLVDALKPAPRFDKFLTYFLNLLQRQGLISVEGNNLTVVAQPDAAPADLLAETIERYPMFTGKLELLAHCAARYSDALSGEIPAISVLYPDGDPEFMTGFERRTAPHSYKRIQVRQVRDLVTAMAQQSKDRPLRILEVGGGNGGLTQVVAPALQGRNVRYTFTDLGTSFVRRMEARAAEQGYDFMDFATLDITREPDEQTVDCYAYDLVLAHNVIHATPDLAETTGHLRKLLRPGGLICITEHTPALPWTDMIWGLAEGWWYFEDDRQFTPLVDAAHWTRVLTGVGFADVEAWPQDPEQSRQWDSVLMIARQPEHPDTDHYRTWQTACAREEETNLRETLYRLRDLERMGAPVQVYRADAADREAMATAVQAIRERFGKIDGVIHAAGVLDVATFQRLNRGATDAMFAPKLDGAMNLAELLRDDPPQQVALCASMSGILGGFGMSAHAAANAFLDAFAHSDAFGPNTRVTAIDWDAWNEIGQAVDRAREEGLKNPDHPLLKRAYTDGERLILAGILDARHHWVLDEHRLDGKALLPGTAYLELARAAYNHHAGDGPVTIGDVFFLKPMTVADDIPVELRVVLRLGKETLAFSIFSAPIDTDNWTEHARGRVGPGRPLGTVDPASLEAGCGGPTREIVRGKSGGFLSFGPRWRNLQRVREGHGRGIAYQRLPDEVRDDVTRFGLHPALLDSATGFLAPIRKQGVLPFAYAKLTVDGALPAELMSYARDIGSADEPAYDVTVFEPSGKVLVEVEGFSLRRAEVTRSSKPATEATGPMRPGQDELLIRLDRTGADLNGNLTGSVITAGSGVHGIPAGGRLTLQPQASPEPPAGSPELGPVLDYGLTRRQGRAVFSMLSGDSRPQVLVSTKHLEDRLQSVGNLQAQPKKQQKPEQTSTSGGSLLDRIGAIWETYLGRKLGPDEDFFDHGGDSLLAIQIVGKLKAELPEAAELTPHSLLNAPTIRSLTQWIAAGDTGEAEGPILLAEGVAGREPIFLIHPIGGQVFFYRDLAKRLGAYRPVYGIQAAGLDGKTTPLTDIPQMAETYLQQIRTVQAEGPPRLAGASFGGAVVFEMTRLLQSQGTAVHPPILIDTPPAGRVDKRLLTESGALAFQMQDSKRFTERVEQLEAMSLGERIETFLKTTAPGLSNESDASGVRNALAVFTANTKALRDYRPQHYPGKIGYIRATEPNPMFPDHMETWWRDHCDNLQLQEVAGDHFTVNEEPLAEQTAELIEAMQTR
ncbi:MAG: SDR family NAD(P)-dependent oxidoreductase [Acidobacteriota bacterium]|nr:SDR family NAD(P)-dependent oxidoreductase [Acidobacteriota bacterium]